MGNKFVMVGGGSTQSPGILEVLRKRAEELNLTDLVLYDIDEERVYLLGQYTKMYYKELGSKVNVTYTTNIDEALKDADFLFMQIRPGLNKQRAIDEKICLNNGVDLLPQLREDVLSGKIDTLLMSNDETVGDQYWVDTYKQMISLFKRFPEYFPNCYLQYYLTPDEMVAHDDPSFTRGNYVMQGREKRIYDECRRVIAEGSAKDSSLHAGVHGNYIVDIAYAIIHNTRERFIVNKKNHGAISNFDPEAVVETPAYIGSMGAETINIGEIPAFQKGLMEMQKAYEKMTVDAALSGSYQKALEAVMLNKTIPNYTVGKKVLDELYAANKGLWPELK